MNIEHLCEIHPVAVIGDDGRCCGRKPLTYKRQNELFCPRCDRCYDATTLTQKENFHCVARPGGFRLSDTAIRAAIGSHIVKQDGECRGDCVSNQVDAILHQAYGKGLLT